MNIHRGFSHDKCVRVVCPDCGAGGASSYPCWCHMCNHRVMMLPACNNHIKSNWREYAQS